MKSIIYIFLPAKKIYPLGVTYLANFIHLHRPDTRQYILDLSTIERGKRYSVLNEKIHSFNPDIIAISWRDIQIFAPHEGDNSLKDTFDFYYSLNPIKKISASISGLRHIATYQKRIKENLSYIIMLRRDFPEKRIIVGGGAFNVFSEYIVQNLPDTITGVIGEGEDFLLKVLDGDDISNERYIKKRGDNILKGIKSKPIDISNISFDISYISSIFPQHKEYKDDIIGVQTKRGCPFHCQFCLYPYIEGRDIRYRRPASVYNEIRQFYDIWGTRRFWFADAQFIPEREAIPICIDLLERIIKDKLDIEWSGYIRTSLITPELAKAMVKSGLGDLEISITSGSQKIIDSLTMGFDLEDLYKGSSYLAEAGFKGRLMLNYSLNLPGEDIDSLLLSIESYKKVSKIMGDNNVYPFIFFLGIQPHTPLEQRLLKVGYLKRGYSPLSLNPFTVKRLIYNPPPLNKLLAEAYLRGSEKGNENIGKEVFSALEAMLLSKNNAAECR